MHKIKCVNCKYYNPTINISKWEQKCYSGKRIDVERNCPWYEPKENRIW